MKKFPVVAGFVLCFVTLFSCVSVDPARKYPHMVADRDPLPVGTIEAEFDQFFSSKLSRNEVDVLFYPRENAVVLEFRYQTIRYRQFWDLQARELFARALDQYKADYEDRNLGNRFSKSRSAYGRITAKTEWETFRFSGLHFGYPSFQLGYRFAGKSPYFTVTQQAARDESEAAGDHMPDSLQILMYYTRSQADELVKIFDQSYLMSLLGPTTGVTAPLEDEYQEPEEYREEEFRD
jgi:hypothetical protein